jgi:hypothetical protein
MAGWVNHGFASHPPFDAQQHIAVTAAAAALPLVPPLPLVSPPPTTAPPQPPPLPLLLSAGGGALPPPCPSGLVLAQHQQQQQQQMWALQQLQTQFLQQLAATTAAALQQQQSPPDAAAAANTNKRPGRIAGIGTRGGPQDARAMVRYEKMRRHRQRRRDQVDTAAEAVEQLAAQAAQLERRAAELRAREGAMCATLGAQDALISTMRALELGGCGAGRRGEVLGAAAGGAGSGDDDDDKGPSAPSAAAVAARGAPAAASSSSDAAGVAAAAPAAVAVPYLPPGGPQLVEDVRAVAKAIESAVSATLGGGSSEQPTGSSLGSGVSSSGGAVGGTSASTRRPVPAPVPARALPSENSSARGMALQFGIMSRRFARLLLALDSMFAQGEAALSARLGGQDGCGATRLAVADALRSRLRWPLRDDERARLRRTAAWRPPAGIVRGDGGAEQQDDDDPAAYGLCPLTGELASPLRLLDALAPVALENEDPPDGPLGFRVGFSESWNLRPEDAEWLRALNFETGEADGGSDARLWNAAAPTIRAALPADLLRRMLAALDLYERSLAGVRAERRRLERTLLLQSATAADDDELPAQLEALVRREDALTFVYEWSSTAMVDALQRARVMLACWPYWITGAPAFDAVRRLDDDVQQ